MCAFLTDHNNHRSYHGEDHADEPETHNYSHFMPTDCFEVMMKWCNSEYFFAIAEFFTHELDDHWECLEYEYATHHDEPEECICHHSDDGESRTEWQWADISHEYTRWMDVEPEESHQCPCDDETEGWEDIESHTIGDESICRILEQEESTSESVESVGDIDWIGSWVEYQDKKWNIRIAKVDHPEEWDMDRWVTEFRIEPVGTEWAKYDEEDCLYTCWESLGLADATDIEYIIDEANCSDTEESEHDYIGFLAVPESMTDTPSEYAFHPWTHGVHSDREYGQYDNCHDDEDSAHCWCSFFSFMELGELDRLTHESFFTYLFPHLQSREKSDTIWHDDKSQQKWCNERTKDEEEIGHG